MTFDTKLFLFLLVVLSVGIALVAIGLGLSGKLAALGTGLLLYVAALKGLAAIWKGRS